MADDVERGFENWKVSGLRAFLLARDVLVCDQAKPVLVQNCYLVVFLGLQAKKSLDEYAQDLGQTILEPLSVIIENPWTVAKIRNFFSFTKKSLWVNYFQKQYSKVPASLRFGEK